MEIKYIGKLKRLAVEQGLSKRSIEVQIASGLHGIPEVQQIHYALDQDVVTTPFVRKGSYLGENGLVYRRQGTGGFVGNQKRI